MGSNTSSTVLFTSMYNILNSKHIGFDTKGKDTPTENKCVVTLFSNLF